MINLGHIWRRKRESGPSPMVPALNRVREMREHTAWEPLTDAATIQKRAEQVNKAREHLIIPADFVAPGVRRGIGLVTTAAARKQWPRELRAPVFASALMALALVAMVLVWVLMYATSQDPDSDSPRITAPAAGFYEDLTDSVADTHARYALETDGYDLSEWRVVRAGGYPDIYLHRISKDEGVIIFQRRRETLSVHVKLEPQDNRIVCTVQSKSSQSK